MAGDETARAAIEISLHEDPIRGILGDPVNGGREFRGYLELASVLEEWRQEAIGAGEAPPAPD